jgi:UDP-N-acetylmuramoyl-tripeptide--D-alanyl-D-alanine ligase
VELGDLQAAENRQVALKAAEVCDLVIVVGDTNKQDLMTGLKEGGLSEDKILTFDNRDKALAHLMSKEFKQPADMILIENDLPDLYEAEVKF